MFTLNALILPPLTVMYTRSLAGRGWCASILIVCTFGLCGTKKYEDPGESLNGSQYVVGVDEPAPPPPPPLSNNPFLKMVASPAQQPSPASQNPNNPFAATSGSQNPNNPFAATSGPVVEGATPSVEEKPRPDPAEKRDTKKLRFTERFFYQHYYKFLKSPARFLVLLAFAGLFFLGAYLWLQLDLPTEPEQWFPADHMFQQYQELATNKVFSAAPTLVNVSIVWGIGGVDDSNTRTRGSPRTWGTSSTPRILTRRPRRRRRTSCACTRRSRRRRARSQHASGRFSSTPCTRFETS